MDYITTKRFPRWLVVFDLVVDHKHVKPFWLTVSKAHSAILMTSHVQVEFTNHWIPLEPFNSDNGSALLLKCLHLSSIEKDDLRKPLAGMVLVTKLLSGSPLYINHAAGFMALSGGLT